MFFWRHVTPKRGDQAGVLVALTYTNMYLYKSEYT